jgi:acetyl esterase/lipase
VVFAADYRSSERQHWEQDGECAYRYVRSIAEDYGGDLDLPVTYIGHLLGATLVLFSGLDDAACGPGGTYDKCFTGASRHDVIVPIAGCPYEYEGNGFGFDISGLSDQEVSLILVVGTGDDVCEPWRSQDAADVLQSAGYGVELVEIDGGNHFDDLVDGEWLTLPDDQAGMEVVQTIVGAIDAAGLDTLRRSAPMGDAVCL